MSMKIAVIGGGSWGTGLAFLMADIGHSVAVWAYEKEVAESINLQHENSLYLPGVTLPSRITSTPSLEEAVRGAQMILFAVPSHVARPVLIHLASLLTEPVPIVSATKGIETGTLRLMTEVMEEVLPPQFRSSLAVLSGPSFAREVALRHPTAVSLAAKDHGFAARLQPHFIAPYFKAFITTDVLGVQIGGALKNVIAVAAGGADG
ncbi:MAG TPA: NAD(P)-binding domain-containing protein, partial [Nitrospiria bacterium]